MDGSYFPMGKDGVTQQELCNAINFKDKPSMTRLIDNMERQHLCCTYFRQKDRRTNLIHLTKDGKELEEKAHHCRTDIERGSSRHHSRRIEHRAGGIKKVFYNTKD